MERVSGVKSDIACMMRVAEFFKRQRIEQFWTIFSHFFHQKSVILGFGSYMHFMGYIQYKICLETEDLYLVPCEKAKGGE